MDGLPKSSTSDPRSQPRGVRCYSVHSLLNDIASDYRKTGWVGSISNQPALRLISTAKRTDSALCRETLNSKLTGWSNGKNNWCA